MTEKKKEEEKLWAVMELENGGKSVGLVVDGVDGV